MRDELIKMLSEITDEEKKILSNSEIDKKVYSAGNSFVINDARLTQGNFGVIMRTHPRYTGFPEHSHTFSEMMIVVSGNIVHTIEGKRLECGVGDILFLNRHIRHSIEKTDTGDLGVNVIISDKFAYTLTPELRGTIFSPFFTENAKVDGEKQYLHFKTRGDFFVEGLTDCLLTELAKKMPDEYAVGKILSLLLYSLSRSQKELLKNEISTSDKDERRKLEIISYLKNNYRNATLSDLAQMLYVTPQYLSKITVGYFGKTFKELLLEERIKNAVELVRKTDIPINKIVRMVGYENESYFHREFKKRTHCTPLQARKMTKNAK